MSDSNGTSGGIGFAGVLTIVFITLKLVGTIDWSWVWVLSPIWIPFAIFAAFFLLYLVFRLPIEAIKHVRSKKSRGF